MHAGFLSTPHCPWDSENSTSFDGRVCSCARIPSVITVPLVPLIQRRSSCLIFRNVVRIKYRRVGDVSEASEEGEDNQQHRCQSKQMARRKAWAVVGKTPAVVY
ncbi:uncharacterized [Tachysurus ichikawai]